LTMKPLVIARCGDSECFPENTLSAFESAIKKGADGVEFDVHRTSDDKLVVHHFYSLGSTDNGTGLVGERSLAELKSLDSGSWFSSKFAGLQKPTLAEVLEVCKGKVRLELEVKSSDVVTLKQVVDELEQFEFIDKTELTTAHYPLLFHAKKISPRLATGTFFYRQPDWMPLRLAQQHLFDWATQLELQIVHVDLSILTVEFINLLRQHDIRVHGSNFDTVEQIGQGLSLDLDGFSTGRLMTALEIRNDTLTPRHNVGD
jgi:glycerophosphoryl diester phosphodiesterase